MQKRQSITATSTTLIIAQAMRVLRARDSGLPRAVKYRRQRLITPASRAKTGSSCAIETDAKIGRMSNRSGHK
jgi:hypothetical protein